MFFDLIYNPIKTPFLEKAEKKGNRTENGLMMFIYQAHQSFVIWNKVIPKIDEEIIKMLSKWLKEKLQLYPMETALI